MPPFSKALRERGQRKAQDYQRKDRVFKASPYDPRASLAMTAIVRVAVIVVTAALFLGALVHAIAGHREVAIMMALGAPLGISALGFARAGHNEAAMALLCCVLVTVVTLTLVVSPLGFQDMASTAYVGVVLVGALLLSRRAFFAIVALTLFAASTAFTMELLGHSRSVVTRHTGWPQFAAFAIMTSVFAVLGRFATERLFRTLGEANDAAQRDRVTGLLNRPGFIAAARNRLREAQASGSFAVLVVADIDAFRRVNLVIGHDAADHVLAEAARRMGLCGADGECVRGRIGDDEFGILCTGIAEAEAESFARSAAEHLNFDFLGVSVRSAAGFARFPRDAHDVEPLLLAAQSAVAHAKTLESDRLAGPADRI